MEMDWGSIIIGFISISLCILPFVLIYYSRINKENKLLQILKEMAQNSNCKIGQREFCGDFVIAADDNKKFVFFLKQKKGELISQIVNLSEVQSCQSVKTTRQAKSINGNLNKVTRIELSFKPKNKNLADNNFELFDEETNIQSNGELQLADKWTEILNNHLQ